MNLVEQLVEIAKEVEVGDPIDWGMLSIDEDSAYTLIANGILESYLMSDKDDRDMIMLATAVKLVVENMVLNMHLQTMRANNGF